MKKNYLRFGLLTAIIGFSLMILPVLQLTGQDGVGTSDPDGAKWLESIRANQNSGVANPDDILAARLQAEAFRAESTGSALNLNWKFAGPDNYPGLVWSAIFDKNDASGNTIIAATEGGGVWKSTNLGLTWNPMPAENNEILKASSLVQTSNGTIYVSTGVTTCKTLSNLGTGIYKYDNGGQFTVIPSTVTNPDFANVSKLVVNASGRIFAATGGGLYYSDNGNDWSKIRSGYCMDVSVGSDGTVITSVGDSAYISKNGTFDNWKNLTTGASGMLPKTGYGWIVFAIAPSDPNVIYASFATPLPDSRMLNIYVSRNKGDSWEIIFPSNPTYDPYRGSGCYSNTISVFPNDPDKIYLGGVNMWYGRKIQTSGFYNWEQVSFGFYSPWVNSSAPAYHHSYMFRPGHPNQIVLATDGGICLATEGAEGLEFYTSNKTCNSSQFYSVNFTTEKYSLMGGGRNVGSLALGYFYPQFTNSMSAGFPLEQPLGLIQGTNGGSGVWSKLNPNIGVFTIRGATTSAYQRQDFRDLTYANDFQFGVTSVYSTYSPMQLWESFTFSNSKDSAKFVAYGESIPANTEIQIESSNGLTFPYLTTSTIPKGDSVIVPDPIASRFFVYGNKALNNYGYGIYMTKDMLKFFKDPEYFVVCKDTATKVDLISAFAVSADLNTLWAGTVKGRMIRVTGLANAYDSLTANEFSTETVLSKVIFTEMPFTGRRVTSISIDPANSGKVLVTLGNYGNNDYVYFTSNGGDATPVFTSVQGNLPKAPVYTGLIELSGTKAIVGTDVGVFSTNILTSGVPQWGADMDQIGNVVATDIRQQTMRDYHVLNYGMIYLATFGRGLWTDDTYYAPVGQNEPLPGNNSTAGTLTLNPNPASDFVMVSGSQLDAGNVLVTVVDLTGRVMLTKSLGYQPKGDFSGSVSIGSLAPGSYIVKVGKSTGKLIVK